MVLDWDWPPQSLESLQVRRLALYVGIRLWVKREAGLFVYSRSGKRSSNDRAPQLPREAAESRLRLESALGLT